MVSIKHVKEKKRSKENKMKKGNERLLEYEIKWKEKGQGTINNIHFNSIILSKLKDYYLQGTIISQCISYKTLILLCKINSLASTWIS